MDCPGQIESGGLLAIKLYCSDYVKASAEIVFSESCALCHSTKTYEKRFRLRVL